MPSKLDHDLQYNTNVALAGFLEQEGRSPDWVATILFYASVHLLEGYLATHSIHTGTHTQRKGLLNRNFSSVYSPIIKDYENMEMLSRKTRYECVMPTEADIREQRARLHRIASHISSVINQELQD